MADHSPCVKIDYINDNLLYEYFFQLSVADIAVFNCLETISTMLSGAAKHNAIYVRHHYTQTNKNNVNKT
jgi:hypothetical protein